MNQGYHINNQAGREASQTLSIRIGENYLGFCRTGTDASLLDQLGWYFTKNISVSFLNELLQRHPELSNNYVRTQLCYDFPHSVLIPEEIYKKGDEDQYLQTMYGLSGSETKISEPVMEWQSRNVYAVPLSIHEWVCQHFPTGSCWHKYTIALNETHKSEETKLLVDFQQAEFTLIMVDRESLLLARTFSYAVPADVVYYLLRACQQFSLSPEKVQVYLSGFIEQDSVLYKELYQYFLHIQFRMASWQAQQGEQDAYPEHFFTSLNDLAQCVL